MKNFTLNSALVQLGLGKRNRIEINKNIKCKLPNFCNMKDFKELFLPYIIIIGDSREKDNWIEKKCKEIGITFINAKKDIKAGTENLKEGDYTFIVVLNDTDKGIFNYINRVAYERKGSAGELYNNCQTGRETLKKEFERFITKNYRKTVLMLEFGDKLIDLIHITHEFYTKNGKVKMSIGKTIYSTIMSWKQPNNNAFEIIQSDDKNILFWLMLQDMFYFWRNEVKNLYIKKMEEEKDGEK